METSLVQWFLRKISAPYQIRKEISLMKERTSSGPIGSRAARLGNRGMGCAIRAGSSQELQCSAALEYGGVLLVYFACGYLRRHTEVGGPIRCGVQLIGARLAA